MSKVIFLPKELAHGFDVVKSYNAYRRWKALAEEDISPEVIFRAGAQWAAMQLGEMIVNDPQFNNIEIHFVEDKMKAQYDFIASEVPWDGLEKEYEYVAIDCGGCAYAYPEAPEYNNDIGCWFIGDSMADTKPIGRINDMLLGTDFSTLVFKRPNQ